MGPTGLGITFLTLPLVVRAAAGGELRPGRGSRGRRGRGRGVGGRGGRGVGGRRFFHSLPTCRGVMRAEGLAIGAGGHSLSQEPLLPSHRPLPLLDGPERCRPRGGSGWWGQGPLGTVGVLGFSPSAPRTCTTGKRQRGRNLGANGRCRPGALGAHLRPGQPAAPSATLAPAGGCSRAGACRSEDSSGVLLVPGPQDPCSGNRQSPACSVPLAVLPGG